MAVAMRLYKDHGPDHMDQIELARIKEDAVLEFMLVIAPRESDERQTVEGALKTMYLVNENTHGYAMRWVTVRGKGEIKVSEIPLKRGRLGEVNVRGRPAHAAGRRASRTGAGQSRS
jgi:hypothetical protein